MKKQYCAIIGDINKSKKLEQRGKVQKKFQIAIDTINTEYKKEIGSKFLITIGDEFQGLLHTPEQSYRLVRRFQDLMNDVPFAFGIGIGTLATEINPKSAIGMDGECFYHAREALLRSKKEKHQITYRFNDRAELIVNALIALLDKQWSRLSKRQRIISMKQKEGLRQSDIARTLRISQQAVSNAIRSKSIKEMDQSVHALDDFFHRFG